MLIIVGLNFDRGAIPLTFRLIIEMAPAEAIISIALGNVDTGSIVVVETDRWLTDISLPCYIQLLGVSRAAHIRVKVKLHRWYLFSNVFSC